MTRKTAGTNVAYVYSTLATTMRYSEYEKIPTINGKPVDKVPSEIGAVVVRGGAGVANKKTLETPYGFVTPVTADELAILERSAVFNAHREAGFVRVEKTKQEVEKIVSKMIGRDESAQAVESDFRKGGRFWQDGMEVPTTGDRHAQ